MSDTKRTPVAWAIVGDDGMVLDSHIYHTRSVAKRNAAEMQETLVPLYRDSPPPVLADAEREALEWCQRNITAMAHPSSAFARIHAATLRGLLARLGGTT